MPALSTATAFPSSSRVTDLATSWIAYTVPDGVNLVYAQNNTGAATVVHNHTGGDEELSVSNTTATLIWSGPMFGGNRVVHLKSDTDPTTVSFTLRASR